MTESNAEETAAFVLYGLWGIIYNDRFTKEKIKPKKSSMEDMIRRLFY